MAASRFSVLKSIITSSVPMNELKTDPYSTVDVNSSESLIPTALRGQHSWPCPLLNSYTILALTSLITYYY